MQDKCSEYTEFIRRSMRQAECGYETMFEPCERCTPRQKAAPCVDACDNNGNEEYLPVMAFIPVQEFGKTYNEAEALCRGTLFPVLDKPFYGRGGNCCGRHA